MKKIISVTTAILLCIAMIFSLAACSGKDSKDETSAPAVGDETTEGGNDAPANLYYSRLNGIPVDESATTSRLVGIVVENLAAARPQWGFTSPAMVVEYEVEGGITRMLWLYDSIEDVPEMVGPVRSARHDAVELAMGLDALFVHIGGSTYAYDWYLNTSVYSASHLDGNVDETFHHKDTSRNVATEHRSVVVGSQLRDRVAQLGTRLTTDVLAPFCFVPEGRELSGTACNSIYVKYSYYQGYTFHYDATKGVYTATVHTSGIPDLARTDENGTACEYSNLVILYADTEDMNDKSGHVDIKLENGGTGLYVNGGVCEQITWRKTSQSSNIELFGANGGTLVMNPGTTYMGFIRATQAANTVIE